MVVQKIAPHPLLRRDVDFYWYINTGENRVLQGHLFPSLSPDVIFNLSFSDVYFGVGESMQRLPHIEVAGAFMNSFQVYTKQPLSLLGVRFFPHTLKYLLREEMPIITGTITDGGLVSGTLIRRLGKALTELPSLTLQIQHLENVFLKRLYVSCIKEDALFPFFSSLHKSEVPGSVDMIVKKLGYSARYTEKLFQKHIGVPPQQYLQIRRLHKAAKLIKSTEESMTAIAYECGFADQSHFIRTFKSLTGKTPLQYKTENPPLNLF